MLLEYRVPVTRRDVRLLTDDGQSHQVTVFVPPGDDVSHLLDAGTAFLPVSHEGRIRLYARSTIAAIASRRQGSDSPPPAEDELLTHRRKLRVVLRGGATLEGVLRFGSLPGQARTADLLNDPARSFTLDVDGALYTVAKDHVAIVDEV